MNWKSLFIISTVFWIGLFFVTNCSQKAPEMAENMDKKPKVTVCPLPDDAPEADKKKCKEIHDQISGYKKVTVETGIDFVTLEGEPIDPPIKAKGIAYDSVTFETLAEELSTLRGFKYALTDLIDITAYSDSNGIDSVYLMLAINTDPKSVKSRKNSPIKYLDMYFQAHNNGKTTTFLQGKSMMLDGFDNFPRPCPYSCPPGE